MGLDDRRQATGRDSGECPKTVTHVKLDNLIIKESLYHMCYIFLKVCIMNLKAAISLNIRTHCRISIDFL